MNQCARKFVEMVSFLLFSVMMGILLVEMVAHQTAKLKMDIAVMMEHLIPHQNVYMEEELT